MSMATGMPWKFGVMADTQWGNRTTDPANPATCAIAIINALNARFIAHGVKFVVQVGDLVDKEVWDCPDTYTNDPFGNAGKKAIRTLPYRAWAVQDLYDAGIGYFPVRGNHEATRIAAQEIPQLFPQTIGNGNMFDTSRIIDSNNPNLVGLSYAFDFNNVRIVFIDQFQRKDGSGSTNDNAIDQIGWVDSTLADRPSDMHAFVMAHKNLSGQNHADCLFGVNATSNLASRDAFIASLQANKVGFYVGGHDHMHHRSIVCDSGNSKDIEQIICASNSHKFYTPKASPNDPSEKVVAQELYTIGYYIFTVDGPMVTVDYYSSANSNDFGPFSLAQTPEPITFYRRERFGYSQNGQEFVVANNESYSVVQDSYKGTRVKILDGINADTNADADFNNREMVKTVKTGWRDRPEGCASAALKLWGLCENLSLCDASLTGPWPNADQDYVTDTYVLSLSYDTSLLRPSQLVTARVCLATKDEDGVWKNAIELNEGGMRKFVFGRWKPGYPLGTYGIDPSSRTAWAVLNRDGEYAVRLI